MLSSAPRYDDDRIVEIEKVMMPKTRQHMQEYRLTLVSAAAVSSEVAGGILELVKRGRVRRQPWRRPSGVRRLLCSCRHL